MIEKTNRVFISVLCAGMVASSPVCAQLGIVQLRPEPLNSISNAPFTQIGAGSWSSGGSGVADRANFAPALSNPAAARLDGPLVYAEFGKRLSADYFGGIEFDNQFILPAYVALGDKLGEWNLSVGYANEYNEKIFFSLPESTPGFPEGTGAYADLDAQLKTHVFFGSAGFDVAGNLSLGLTLGLNYITYDATVFTSPGHATGTGMIINVGGMWQAGNNLALGAAVRYASTINTEIVYISEPSPLKAQFPVSAELGGKFEASSRLSLMMSVETEFWGALSSGQYSDIVDLHMGGRFRFSGEFAGSLGLFTQQDPGETRSAYLNQIFLSAGIEWKSATNITSSLTILDSHLLSNNSALPYATPPNQHFNQTYIVMGIGHGI